MPAMLYSESNKRTNLSGCAVLTGENQDRDVSVEAHRAVWAYNEAAPDDSKVTGGELAVWAALAEHANAAGYCWPGVRRLARKCGVDPRTVQRHLRSLERKGILRTTIQGGKGAMTNAYVVPVIGKGGEKPQP